MAHSENWRSECAISGFVVNVLDVVRVETVGIAKAQKRTPQVGISKSRRSAAMAAGGRKLIEPAAP